MSGHSKWSTIKRKKGATDSKRGKIFTRLMREITIATKQGGNDIEGNPRLRTAIDLAKSQNMPKDNIERAIKKGSSESDGVAYEEVIYEGYGPSGVAFLIECLTDNKNRTASEIRHIFTKRGGALSKSGSVSYLFENKGYISFPQKGIDEDKIIEIALESDANDIKNENDLWKVYTNPSDLTTIIEIFKKNKFKPIEAFTTKIASTLIKIEEENTIKKILAIHSALDETDDVQNIYSNFYISETKE